MPVRLADETVAAGEAAWTEIPVARDADGTRIGVDARVVNGASDGPTLWAQGAVHGNEPVGGLAVREFARDLDPAEVRGTVVAVPVANPVGFADRSRGAFSHLGTDDVNGAFPGDPDGSFPQQAAHALHERIAAHADAFVDLHSADEQTLMHEAFAFLPAVGGDVQREAHRLATATGVPRVAELPPAELDGFAVGVLADGGIPGFVLESGTGATVRESALDYYRDGLQNAARELGVLAGDPEPASPTTHDAISFCFAHAGGFVDVAVRGGDRVAAGDHLATTTGVRGETLERVEAPHDAVVLAVRSHPTVRPGDLVVELAPTDAGGDAANRPG